MTHGYVTPGGPGARYYTPQETEEEVQTRPRFVGLAMKILLGLVIAADVSFLAAPLYYGMAHPCKMVALSQASLYSEAVDEEIGVSDEINEDVFQVSSYWVRNGRSIPSCAGEIGGRTLARLFP